MFTGADEAFYELLVAQLAVGCLTRLLSKDTCPNANTTTTATSSSNNAALLPAANTSAFIPPSSTSSVPDGGQDSDAQLPPWRG